MKSAIEWFGGNQKIQADLNTHNNDLPLKAALISPYQCLWPLSSKRLL